MAPIAQSALEPEQDEPFFRRFPANPELAGIVAGIVGYRENGRRLSGQVQIAPLTMPLVISFGEPFAIGLGSAPSPIDRWGSFAAGLFAGPVVIDSTGRAECIQIDFTPLGAYRFFGLPMNELSSRMVTLDDLGDRGIVRLRQRLGEEPSWSHRLNLAEDFIINRLRRASQGHKSVQAAYSEIVSAHGNLRISAIAKTLDCSRKHLVERFQAELGLAPKTIARMVRFHHTLSIARSSAKPDWAGIAADCGYADQAHLTREFTEFSGASPSLWLAKAA